MTVMLKLAPALTLAGPVIVKCVAAAGSMGIRPAAREAAHVGGGDGEGEGRGQGRGAAENAALGQGETGRQRPGGDGEGIRAAGAAAGESRKNPKG